LSPSWLIGCEAWGEHLQPLVIFLLYTGARIGEALWLDWRDIDLTRGHATPLQQVVLDVEGSQRSDVPLRLEGQVQEGQVQDCKYSQSQYARAPRRCRSRCWLAPIHFDVLEVPGPQNLVRWGSANRVVLKTAGSLSASAVIG
jgi:hypothetical protein